MDYECEKVQDLEIRNIYKLYAQHISFMLRVETMLNCIVLFKEIHLNINCPLFMDS